MAEAGTENDKTQFRHEPVLLSEVISSLNIRPDGIYLDGTAGGAGHSSAIASLLDGGKLVALDRDADAVAVAGERLARFGERAQVVHANFADMKSVCCEMGIDRLDGVLLDLGVSSYQLDCAERGFSYIADAPLDMRMDRSGALSAREVVNGYPESELTRILYRWGEEKFAPRIAREIYRAREKKEISTTGELAAIVRAALPDGGRSMKHHPAMRTFQAIRIEVNGELAIIPEALRDAVSLLSPGGRIAVITFHSLEDRAVKETFAELAQGCVCPRDFPVCVCGRLPVIKQITKKPILPGEKELKDNIRSHSAKLRVAQKL